MTLPISFPLYPDPLPLIYNVSLSLPKVDSVISSRIGSNDKTSLLTPNMSYINKFLSGDLGISSNINKQSMVDMLNSDIIKSDPSVMSYFLERNSISIIDPNSPISSDNIRIDNNPNTGFSGFEKTVLTSIMETQKPFIEVTKLAIDSIAKIEDIIARIMPLIGVPFVTKSLKPSINKGNDVRPPSLGYNDSYKNSINSLNGVSSGSNKYIDQTEPNFTTNNTENKLNDITKWEIVSTKYSTGIFIKGVNYEYSYIDLPSSVNDVHIDSKSNDVVNNKPRVIVLGLYKSDGTPIDPKDKIKNAQISSSNLVYVDSKLSCANWLYKTNKWILSDVDGGYIKKIGNPIYLWNKNSIYERSYESPGVGWSISKYKKDQKNILDNNINGIEGEPIVVGFNNIDSEIYNSYVENLIHDGIEASGSKLNKSEIFSKVINRVNVDLYLDNLSKYSQLKSKYEYINGKSPYPESIRSAYLPFRLNINGEKVWIDPESEYSMKVIRVDPVMEFNYTNISTGLTNRVSIKSFIKNKIDIRFDDNIKFNIEVIKNGDILDTSKDVTSYIIDNWNYNGVGQIDNRNRYKIKIDSSEPPGFYLLNKSNVYYKNLNKIDITYQSGKWFYSIYEKSKDIDDYIELPKFSGYTDIHKGVGVYVKSGIIDKWIYLDRELSASELPNMGEVIKMTLSRYNIQSNRSLYSIERNNIQTSQLKIVNKLDGSSSIIDVTDKLNDHLITNEPYSSGYYGIGDGDQPQKISIIKRVMLNEYDTDSYYIVEGIRNDYNDDRNKSEESRSSYYTIPHAFGSIAVFVPLLIDIFTKVIPSMTSTMNLFSNPSKFITNIIKDKITGNFIEYSKSATSILDWNVTQSIVDKSALSNNILVTEGGDLFKSNLDGYSEVPINIFGINSDIGMEVDFSKAPNNHIDMSNTREVSTLNEYLRNRSISKYRNNTTYGSFEIIDIKYSTGVYIEGINYEYSYVNINNTLISDIENLLKSNKVTSVDVDRMINRVNASNIPRDDKSDIISNLIDKIEYLPDGENSMVKAILGFVTLPIKMVSGIIEYFIGFFESLSNPFTLVNKMIDFLSFKWIIDIINPLSVIDMAGVYINADIATKWCSDVNTSSNDGINRFKENSDEYANWNKVFKTPFTTNLPIYSADMQRSDCNNVIKSVSPMLCLIEKLVNSIIDLIWAIMGIEVIIPPPHIKLCMGNNPTIDDLKRISDGIKNKKTKSEMDLDYVYDIKLDNGDIIYGLSKFDLDEYISNNRNTIFKIL